MSGYVLPLLLTAALLAMMYFCCVRPMRRGAAGHVGPHQQAAARSCCGAPGGQTDQDADVDAEIKRLREKVQVLRHEVDQRPGDAGRSVKGEFR
ncbi:hypothetical protein ABZ173_38800 [Streptomyces rochei]|uniref:hypothetical protein n=1 Tax=Streptomyces rochei TaxID=1928 RepID=UPI0033B90812